MARPKKEYPPEKLAALRADWVGSTLSPNALEQKHGIPRSTIRGLMDGIEREGGEKKRAILRAAAAGVTDSLDDKSLDRVVRNEAQEDIRVMSVAAKGAKGIIERAEKLIAEVKNSWELPMMANALAQGMTVYRKARELETPLDEAPVRKVRVIEVDP